MTMVDVANDSVGNPQSTSAAPSSDESSSENAASSRSANQRNAGSPATTTTSLSAIGGGRGAMTSEVEETIARIRSHKGVEGVLVLSRNGGVIQSTLNVEQSVAHAAIIAQLISKASLLVTTLDASDEVTFLRLRSRNREIMVAPDAEYILIVIQNPNGNAD